MKYIFGTFKIIIIIISFSFLSCDDNVSETLLIIQNELVIPIDQVRFRHFDTNGYGSDFMTSYLPIQPNESKSFSIYIEPEHGKGKIVRVYLPTSFREYYDDIWIEKGKTTKIILVGQYGNYNGMSAGYSGIIVEN